MHFLHFFKWNPHSEADIFLFVFFQFSVLCFGNVLSFVDISGSEFSYPAFSYRVSEAPLAFDKKCSVDGQGLDAFSSKFFIKLGPHSGADIFLFGFIFSCGYCFFEISDYLLTFHGLNFLTQRFLIVSGV